MDKQQYKGKPLPFPAEIAHRPTSKPIPSAYRPPIAQSAWSSGQLSNKPFWEASGNNDSSTPAQQQQPQQEQQQQQHSHTTTAPPSPPPASAQTLASTWGSQPLQEHPKALASTPEHSYQPSPAPATIPAHPYQPSPAPSPQSSTPLAPAPGSPPMTRKQRKSLGSYASKYAPIPPPSATSGAGTATATATATTSTTNAPATTPPPPPPVAAAAAPIDEPAPPVISGTISLSDLLAPLSPPPAQQPLFELDIELIPGVSALLPVHETEDYITLVKEFGARHHLSIAPDAERSFANKIQQMVTEMKKFKGQ